MANVLVAGFVQKTEYYGPVSVNWSYGGRHFTKVGYDEPQIYGWILRADQVLTGT